MSTNPTGLNAGRIIGSIFIVYLIAAALSLLLVSTQPLFSPGNVAVIPITGEITAQGSPSTLFSPGSPGADDYVREIQAADSDPRFDAIVLKIDSGGGSPVGSREVMQAVREAHKPVIAYIGEVGASGAYWIAAASDEIIADPLAITGSVGVRASYLQVSGLLARYNVTYEQVNGGQYKDIGTPFANLTSDERALLMQRIDYMHTYFYDSVVSLRNLSNLTANESQTIRSGIYFVGPEAVKLGLVDELGGWSNVTQALEARGIRHVTYAQLRQSSSPLAGIAGLSRSVGTAIGKGIGSQLSSTSAPSLT